MCGGWDDRSYRSETRQTASGPQKEECVAPASLDIEFSTSVPISMCSYDEVRKDLHTAQRLGLTHVRL